MTRERRGSDRPIKRLRQLEARLDVLLHDSQELRNVDTASLTSWPAVHGPDRPPKTSRPPRK
jgi:hypothetical protein